MKNYENKNINFEQKIIFNNCNCNYSDIGIYAIVGWSVDTRRNDVQKQFNGHAILALGTDTNWFRSWLPGELAVFPEEVAIR